MVKESNVVLNKKEAEELQKLLSNYEGVEEEIILEKLFKDVLLDKHFYINLFELKKSDIALAILSGYEVELTLKEEILDYADSIVSSDLFIAENKGKLGELDGVLKVIEILNKRGLWK